jgi:hypothetical protein
VVLKLKRTNCEHEDLLGTLRTMRELSAHGGHWEEEHFEDKNCTLRHGPETERRPHLKEEQDPGGRCLLRRSGWHYTGLINAVLGSVLTNWFPATIWFTEKLTYWNQSSNKFSTHYRGSLQNHVGWKKILPELQYRFFPLPRPYDLRCEKWYRTSQAGKTVVTDSHEGLC